MTNKKIIYFLDNGIAESLKELIINNYHGKYVESYNSRIYGFRRSNVDKSCPVVDEYTIDSGANVELIHFRDNSRDEINIHGSESQIELVCKDVEKVILRKKERKR